MYVPVSIVMMNFIWYDTEKKFCTKQTPVLFYTDNLLTGYLLKMFGM